MDVRKFIINSDYPMDFIVWKGSGDVSSSGYNQSTITIAHGLNFTPLVFGQFSLDDGSTWFPLGLYDHYTNKVDIGAESDGTNVYVNFTCLDSGSKTAKVRLWGLAPSTADSSVTVPSGVNHFRLNSDFNYSKLVAAGRWPIQTGSRQTIYSHNLGYVPEVMTWVELSNGRIREPSPQFSNNTGYWPTQCTEIDDHALYGLYTSNSAGSETYTHIHYRIYGGQNG